MQIDWSEVVAWLRSQVARGIAAEAQLGLPVLIDSGKSRGLHDRFGIDVKNISVVSLSAGMDSVWQ